MVDRCITKRRYLKRYQWYNSNNHLDMAPFYSIDGKILLVKSEQYQAWKQTDALNLLREKFEEVREVRKGWEVPTLSGDVADAPQWFWDVYQTLIKRANAQRWFSCIPKSSIIPITDEQSLQLFNENNPDDTSINSRPVTEWLRGQIEKSLHSEEEHGYFIKCGTCSTKHHYLPIAVYTAKEATDHLLGAFPVLRALKTCKAQCILIRPFDPRVNDNNELRVFVRDKKVVGVSQQACYDFVIVLAMMSADDIIKACQKCYDDFNSQLQPEYQFNHQCTFDAYFTTDPAGQLTVHLIEINSGMFGWGPAGSSLFHWKHDPPPQADEPPVFYIIDVM
jgi:hypothetical protein